MQVDYPIGIFVPHTMDARAHRPDNVEFLEELAAQRLGMSFVRETLSARKFPVTGEMRPVGTKREQEGTVSLDHGGDDNDRRHLPANTKDTKGTKDTKENVFTKENIF
jgi:hypothetical protein